MNPITALFVSLLLNNPEVADNGGQQQLMCPSTARAAQAPALAPSNLQLCSFMLIAAPAALTAFC